MATATTYKVFKDPIHGEIKLDPICVKIVDTVEFQRLRFIKQLGGCCFLYHGAGHSRFEHSIGTCHLAGQLVCAIHERQPDMVTHKEILCVKVAGLCHDLGHGPFSHLFDHLVQTKFPDGEDWTHETASKKILGKLSETLQMTAVNGNIKFQKEDWKFIKELIDPPEDLNETILTATEEKKKKHFLYEIVSNPTCGVDVDKWDYLSRDSYYLGVKNMFDHGRFIASARVCMDDDGVNRLCYRDKDMENMYEMFHTRLTLHRKAYQHRVTQAVQCMIGEALMLACDHIAVPGKDGKMKKMIDVCGDMDAYCCLTDDILLKILHLEVEHADVRAAKTLITRIFERDLYRFIGEVELEDSDPRDEDALLADFEEQTSITMNEVIIKIAKFDYGAENENPVDKAFFYSKDSDNIARRQEHLKTRASKLMIPSVFRQKVARIFCKSKENEEDARKKAEQWIRSYEK